MPNGMEQPVSERERWDAENRLREKEIAARSGWGSPLVISLLLIAFALLANAVAIRTSNPGRVLVEARQGEQREAPASSAHLDNRPLNARADLAEKWLDGKGGYIFPSKDIGYEDGCLKPAQEMTLEVGKIIDRYGGPGGRFLAPAGTSYEARAVPYDRSKMAYYRYQVVQSLKVQACEAVPWFDQAGGGTQYKVDKPVQQLLADGVLKDVSDR